MNMEEQGEEKEKKKKRQKCMKILKNLLPVSVAMGVLRQRKLISGEAIDGLALPKKSSK